MKWKQAWRGLASMFLIGITAGVINLLVFLLVMNPLTAGSKTDEIAVNTYVIDFFVGWALFSAWFLTRADEEFKKVEEAVRKADRESFLVEAPKQEQLLDWLPDRYLLRRGRDSPSTQAPAG